MNRSQAFVAGLSGGVIMTLLMAVGRAMGLGVNLEMILGTMFGLDPGFGTWVFGLIVHLAISGLIGLAYGAGFEYWLHRADWKAGALLSLIHIVVGGLFMAAVPALHPLIPETMSAPGAFLSNFGPGGIFTFFLIHIVYGSVVGGIYDMRVRQKGRPFGAKPYDESSRVA